MRGSTRPSTINLSSSVSAPLISRRISLSRSRRKRRTTRASFSKTCRSGTMRTSSTPVCRLWIFRSRLLCTLSSSEPIRTVAGSAQSRSAIEATAARWITSSPTRFINSSSLRISTLTVSLMDFRDSISPRVSEKSTAGRETLFSSASGASGSLRRVSPPAAGRHTVCTEEGGSSRRAARPSTSCSVAVSSEKRICDSGVSPGEGRVDRTSPTSRMAFDTSASPSSKARISKLTSTT